MSSNKGMKRLAKILRSIADKVDPQKEQIIPSALAPGVGPVRMFEYGVITVSGEASIQIEDLTGPYSLASEFAKRQHRILVDKCVNGILEEAKKHVEILYDGPVDGKHVVRAVLYLYKEKEE